VTLRNPTATNPQGFGRIALVSNLINIDINHNINIITILTKNTYLNDKYHRD